MKEAFEKIKERLEEEAETVRVMSDEDDYFLGKWSGICEALSIIHEEAKAYNNGWIPCKERLPEDNTRVLACFPSGTVTELAYLGEGMFSGLYKYTTKVIVAWQPLPQPYQEGE